MLDAADLAMMRAAQAEAMPDSVQVWRRTQASDGAGGLTESWSLHSTLSGRAVRTQRGTTEQVVGGRASGVATWRVVLPVTASVTLADRLVIAGCTLEVNSVNTAQFWRTACIAECTEIAP